jgi:hypothetical protein
MQPFRGALSGLGFAVFALSGLAMFVLELFWFYTWWGIWGLIAAFAVPPLVGVFPFVLLFMEGFSPLYFGLWGLGFAGGIFGAALSN